MSANISIPLLQHPQANYEQKTRHPPSVGDATLALADLRTLLKSRNAVIHLDIVLRTRLDHLDRFLAIYIAGRRWIKAADYSAVILGQGSVRPTQPSQVTIVSHRGRQSLCRSSTLILESR